MEDELHHIANDRSATPSRGSRPRAIVTGGAGFVGSHLVDRLLADGWSVLVIDDLSTGYASNVGDAVRIEQLDVAVDALDPVIGAWHPQVVYHLAAQASVPQSIQAPLRDLAVNVTGTHRVATAARTAGAKRLVFVSSGGAIYGETHRAASETTRTTPTSYYGIHKLAAEGHVVLSGLPYAIARPSNIYGPRQSSGLEGAVVAAFVGQALARQPLTIDGDGGQTRDFIHVSDVVEALLRLGDSAGPVGIWNVAYGRRLSIARLADVIERAAGVQLGRVHRSSRVGDVRDSASSAAHLRAFGWKPTISISRGIRELVAPDSQHPR